MTQCEDPEGGTRTAGWGRAWGHAMQRGSYSTSLHTLFNIICIDANAWLPERTKQNNFDLEDGGRRGSTGNRLRSGMGGGDTVLSSALLHILIHSFVRSPPVRISEDDKSKHLIDAAAIFVSLQRDEKESQRWSKKITKFLSEAHSSAWRQAMINMV